MAMKINVKIQDTQYEVIIENINERPVKAVIEGLPPLKNKAALPT